ncbi:MAG: hypothetical protein ACFFG0_01890 [Candidatus Thorarchaeota archaeon]
MRKEGPFLQEIRINPDYTHLGFSEYEKMDTKSNSKTIIKNNSLLTKDYTDKLSKNLSSDVTIFPPNCRYLEHTDKGTLVLIEEPPAIRTISVSIKRTDLVNQLIREGKLEEYGYGDLRGNYGKSPYRFSLAFPYVIFILFFNEYFEYKRAKIFLRSRQLSGFSDNLLRNPMLNINSEQNVCLGDKIYGKRQSLYEAVHTAIDVWWGSTFNFDYTENYNAYKSVPIINNYLEWEYFSRQDPMFIYNVDWIEYTQNIYQTLERVKNSVKATKRLGVSYHDMVKIFTKPIDTGAEEKPTSRSRKTYKLFYDITQSVYLDTSNTLNVGDPMVMKNGEIAHLYSFVGFMTGGNIKYVQYEKNGRLFYMLFSDPFIKFMLKQIKKDRFMKQATLKNGEVIKPGKIIIIKSKHSSDIYKKVDYIRKGRIINNEETHEIKCGNNYYLSTNLDAKVFDLKKPVISGININKKDNYIFIREQNTPAGLVPASLTKFKEMDVTTDGKLFAYFDNITPGLKGERHYSYFNESKNLPNIIPEDKVRLLTSPFRLGRRLYYIKNGSRSSNSAWAYNGAVLYENYFSITKPLPKMIQNLIKDDKFSVGGPDFDTEFKIGDKVVVADWTKPIEVLNVKTITGFKYDSSTAKISFVLLSKDEKLSEVEYVNGIEGTINTGFIRRVTNKYKNLTVGTKIIAKKTGICNFPKKDINIIVAIINDGPYEPLILCSNGCTLWFSTVMNDFQRVTTKAKKWKNLQHVPLDMSKIKFQAGDIINGRRDFKRRNGYIIHDPSTTRYLKVMALDYYSGYPDSNVFDKYFSSDAIFDSIPTPRISVAKQSKMKVINGFIDFHGGIIPDAHKRTTLKFLDERGGK